MIKQSQQAAWYIPSCYYPFYECSEDTNQCVCAAYLIVTARRKEKSAQIISLMQACFVKRQTKLVLICMTEDVNIDIAL